MLKRKDFSPEENFVGCLMTDNFNVEYLRKNEIDVPDDFYFIYSDLIKTCFTTKEAICIDEYFFKGYTLKGISEGLGVSESVVRGFIINGLKKAKKESNIRSKRKIRQELYKVTEYEDPIGSLVYIHIDDLGLPTFLRNNLYRKGYHNLYDFIKKYAGRGIRCVDMSDLMQIRNFGQKSQELLFEVFKKYGIEVNYNN